MSLILALASIAVQNPEDPAKPEARAAVVKAFEATAALGGFEFKGEVEKPEDDDAMGFHFDMGGGSYLGKFTGRVGKDGTIHVQAKGDHATIDIYRKGAKTVKRQTWSGAALSADKFADEALSMIDLTKIGKLVADASEKDCRISKETKVDGVDAIVVKVKMPKGVIESSGEAAGVMHFDMMELKDVQASFTISKADSRILKVKFGLEFGLSESMKVQMGDEGGDGMDMKEERDYLFDVVKYDAEMKIDVPEDVKALLEK